MKSADFWSEWRDLNPRPLGPELRRVCIIVPNVFDKCDFALICELFSPISPPQSNGIWVNSVQKDGSQSRVIQSTAVTVCSMVILYIMGQRPGKDGKMKQTHFGFHPYFPKNSNTLGADIVIHSLHKTLPSLTQTALLHMNGELANRTDIREYVHMLQSSSPSYILMAGIDECVRFVGERSSDVFDNYVKRLESVRKRISRLSVLKLIETEKYDRSKIVTAVGNHGDEDINRFTGKQLYDVLKDKYLLQPEMASGSYVVLMTSPADTDEGMASTSL